MKKNRKGKERKKEKGEKNRKGKERKKEKGERNRKRKIEKMPWWPSGLRQHEISQLIVATEGPQFEFPLGITILIAQS